MQGARIFAIRMAAASAQAIGWLTMACVMLLFMLIAFACIIVRVAFNVPMIVWHAANNKAPHP